MGRGGGSSSGSGGTGGGSRGFSSHRSGGTTSGRSFSSGGSKLSSVSSSKSTPRRETKSTSFQRTPPKSEPRKPGGSGWSSPPPPRRSSWGSPPPPRRSGWGAPPPPRRSVWGAPPPPPHRSVWGAPPPPPPVREYGGTGRRNTGCLGCFGWLFVVLMVIGVFVAIPLQLAKKPGGSSKKVQVPVQTEARDDRYEPWEEETQEQTQEHVKRVKLGAEACIRTDGMIKDTLEWLSDTKTVEKAMNQFYKKTGVQPYLYICNKIEGKGGEITDEEAQSFGQSLYDSMYQDEGHMIFIFMEYADSEYATFLYTGAEADQVMDADAREIFLDCADEFYTDSTLNDEEYFAKIFRESAKEIMR